MPIKFTPIYTQTDSIAKQLAAIENSKQQVGQIKLSSLVLSALQDSVRLVITHYSTMMEGNKLSSEQVDYVLKKHGHFIGKEKDIRAIKGYYAALKQVEEWAINKEELDERKLHILHALVSSSQGRLPKRITGYRMEELVAQHPESKRMVTIAPLVKDLSGLIQELCCWIIEQKESMPIPVLAAMAYYHFIHIHPYGDDNARVGRLIMQFILYRYGYHLQGLYCLEEYYMRHLRDYYAALGERVIDEYVWKKDHLDCTMWVDFFLTGMTVSVEHIMDRVCGKNVMDESDGVLELYELLDDQQKALISYFKEHKIILSTDIANRFGLSRQAAGHLCNKWVHDSFLTIVNNSKKNRTYCLHYHYEPLVHAKYLYL